jgi:hypothetical protein
MTDEMRRLVIAIRLFAKYLPESVQLGGPAETSRLQLIDAADQLLGEKDVA